MRLINYAEKLARQMQHKGKMKTDGHKTFLSIFARILFVLTFFALYPLLTYADFSQDFTDWETPMAFDNYETNGWQLNDGAEYNDSGLLNASNANLRSTFSSNGIGRVTWRCSLFSGGSVTFRLQTSPDGTNWTDRATNTCTMVDPKWQYYTNDLTIYDGLYVQWHKDTASPFLYIDDVNIRLPPSYVNISNVMTHPEQPLVETSNMVSATVEPEAGASNLTVSLFYRTETTSEFAGIPMSTNASGAYVTDEGLAINTANLTVQYYIMAQYDGRYNTGADYYPSAGASDPTSFVARALSPYTNMLVKGSSQTNLLLVENNTWQGVLTTNSVPLVDPVFYFESGSNTWGDDIQSVSNLPVYGTAQGGSTNITIEGTVTSHLAFAFNDDLQDYSIQKCEYIDFDDWIDGTTGSYGTYTNKDGWVLDAGRVNKDADNEWERSLRGRYAILKYGYANQYGEVIQYLRSPRINEGVGKLFFWHRNWEEDGNPDAGYVIEKSQSGAGDWITVPNSYITNIVYAGYLRAEISIADRNAHYVRIVNTNQNNNSWLCLDEVIVTEPGATVALTDPWRRTNSPLLGESLDLSVSVTNIAGGATNLQALTWFRHADWTEFNSVEMVRSNNTFLATIPALAQGAVEYYFECTYDGFNSAPAYYPDGGPSDPNLLTYTNQTSLSSKREEDFQVWTTPLVLDDYTNNAGWSLHHGAVYNQRGLLGESSQAASLTTPSLTEGVGTVYFDLANFSGDNENAVAVQTSTNGSSWTTESIVTNSLAYEGRNEKQVTVNDHAARYVRFLKTNSVSEVYVYIDNVIVSIPPSDVDITDQYYSPGYPMTNDEVSVSCTITSKYEMFPAYNFAPELSYRLEGGTWSSLAMSLQGSNTYAATIPALTPGTVEYYIKCDFDGFYYGPENQSPAFFPDAPSTNTRPDTYFSYEINHHKSDFSQLQIDSEIGAEQMGLIGDNYWQGVLTVWNPTNEVVFGIAGYDQWLGSDYSQDAVLWGDTNQATYSMPIHGQIEDGSTSFTVRNNFSGTNQFVIRFDTTTGEYFIFEGAFQDFNSWDAPTEHFDYSVTGNKQNIINNDFDSWPLDDINAGLPDTVTETVETWDPGEYFTESTYAGNLSGNGWYSMFATVSAEPKNNQNQALLFDPTDAYPGREGRVWPYKSALTKGTEKIQFKYRWFVDDHNLAWYQPSVNLSNYTVSATIETTEKSPDPAYSLIALYQDADNYYEFKIKTDIKNNDNIVYQFNRRRNGNVTLLKQSTNKNENMNNTMYVDFNVCSNNNGSILLSVNANDEQNIYDAASVSDSDPLDFQGAYGFFSEGADIRVDNVVAYNSHRQYFDSWTNDASGWFIQDGYILNDDDNPRCALYGNTEAELVTPYLDYDLGSLQFSYRRGGQDGSDSAELAVYGSNDKSSWTLITSSIVSNKDDLVTTNITSGISGYSYLRIRNDNSTEDQLVLDNIRIKSSDDICNETFSTSSSTSDWVDVTGDIWYYDSINQSYNRPGQVGPPATIVVQKALTNDSTTTGPPDYAWTNAAIMTVSNMQYQTASVPFYYWDELFVRVISEEGGDATVVIDDISINRWRGTDLYTDTNDWQAAGIWVSERATSNNCVELWRSRINPAKDQYIRSPEINGVGSLSFLYKGYYSSSSNLQFNIEIASASTPESYVTLESVTVTNTDWRTYTAMIQTNEDVYLRIKHTSPETDAILYIDNIQISDYVVGGAKTWEAYNALITPDQDTREFENIGSHRTCYLNNRPNSDTPPGKDFYDNMPYVQSPQMPDGIGEISFWYRNWEDNGDPSAKLYVCSSPTDGGTFDDWTTICEINPISNTDYKYFSTNHYNSTHHFVRVYSSTNTGKSRVCLDNLLITEPLAVNLSLTNMITIPEVPVSSSPVNISIQTYNPILNPRNIKGRAYYHIGTNLWAQWDQWNTNDYVELDDVTINSAVEHTYQSSVPIPQLGVNTVVQYYVEFTFQGPHADAYSPKAYTHFVKPDYYDGLDLNADHGAETPYYIVFGSKPGDVWINEVNYANKSSETTNEYLEIVGKSGIDISDWRIELVSDSEIRYDYSYVTNGSPFLSETNGFGFIVYGDPTLGESDLVFTNPSTQNIYKNGGARLIRGSGAYADKVCWGISENAKGMTNLGYRYIGYKGTAFAKSSLYATGEGIEKDDFDTWVFNGDFDPHYSAGEANEDQTLVKYAETQTLSVASAFGTAEPAPGTHDYPSGSKVTCRVTDSPVNVGTMATQYLCTGWSGSGDIPPSGSTTNTGEIMLLTDSSITWQWITNVYLDIQTDGNGTVDNSGWLEQYSAVTVTATAAEYHAFTGWSGNTNGWNISSNQLVTDSLDKPGGPITAHFVSTDRSLDVSSQYDATNIAPATGSHVYHNNDPLSCMVSNRAVYNGTMATQYWVTGWSRTGSVPPMPLIGAESNFLWECNSGIETWEGNDGDNWKAILVADGDKNGLGNFIRDEFGTNGISAGDDRILTNATVLDFGGKLYWDTSVNIPTGLRVYTVVFNSSDISTATHYVAVTNGNSFFTVDGQDYDCGTALSSEWTALASPATNNTAISSGPFNITADSSINWLWQTNHYLDTSVTGSGTVDVASSFLTYTDVVTITASPETDYVFDSWSGDTSGCSITDNQIDVPMDIPRSITANFLTGSDTTAMGTPYTWLQQYYSDDYDYYDANDSDEDGMLGWMEYVTGTDPTNDQSTFEILEIGYGDGSNFIKWYATTNSGVYEPFGVYRTTNILEGWGSPYVTNTGPRDPDGTGINIWWDTNLPSPDIPTFYRPYVVWTNSQ